MKISNWVVFFSLFMGIGLVHSSPLAAQEATSSVEESELLAETEELARDLEIKRDEAVELFRQYEAAEGEDALIVRAQISRRFEEIGGELEEFVKDIITLRDNGEDVSRPQSVALEVLNQFDRFIKRDYQQIQDAVKERRAGLEDLTSEERIPREQEITQSSKALDRLLESLYELASLKETLGLDVAQDLDYIKENLTQRADALAGGVELSMGRESEMKERLRRALDDEKPALQNDLQNIQERLRGATESLSASIALMDRLELDANTYKELVIRATGTVTTDIFNLDVALGLVERGWNTASDWFVATAPQFFFNIALFLLILFVFKVLARVATRIVSRAVASAEPAVPVLLKNMALSVTSKLIMLLGLLIALSQLGIQIGPLLAGVGVAGFIVGFALQETLSNFASGMMILVYHPFDVGDVIEAGGVSGKVSSMSLVSTTINTFDNQKLIVPNNKIWGDVIRNKTAETTRRVDMVFGISYADDIDRAEALLQEIVRSHDLILEEPEPMIRLHNLGDSSVDFIVRPWTKTDDYWSVFWDITRAVKKRFDQEGISIPFPQRDVHVYHESAPEPSEAPAAASPIGGEATSSRPVRVDDIDETKDEGSQN
jgi:small conductance mechanosensitive channel